MINIDDKEKLKILEKFSKEILTGMQEPDSEFCKIVNENFWDMV